MYLPPFSAAASSVPSLSAFRFISPARVMIRQYLPRMAYGQAEGGRPFLLDAPAKRIGNARSDRTSSFPAARGATSPPPPRRDPHPRAIKSAWRILTSRLARRRAIPSIYPPGRGRFRGLRSFTFAGPSRESLSLDDPARSSQRRPNAVD